MAPDEKPKRNVRAPCWTKQEIDTLVEMVTDKRSYTEIGRRLGRPKNACVGKAWRIGLMEPKDIPPSPPRYDPYNGLHVKEHCHFPIGHPTEDGFHFCGAEIETPGRTYCDNHHRKAYERRIVHD